MKKKRTAQSAPSRRSLGEGGFFNLRALIAFLVFGAATCSVLSGALLAFFRTEAPANISQRSLTFAERVGYQRAIEEVYWHHRIWPRNRGERPDPKPSLDVVMSQAQLEKKVQNYLRESQALEAYWQKPITPDQLQTEMERMARNTKQPEVLRELFEALGNDPSVIAECLARPVLAERLVADLSAHEKGQRFALLRTQVSGSKFSITTSGKATYTLPEIDPCTDDTWTPTSLTNAPTAREGHTAVWTGSEMIVWGATNDSTGGRYNPTTDSWTATSTTNAPTARSYHTAVWSGSEMIVWGGLAPGSLLNTGGRYNPTTDTWTATTTTGAPAERYLHTAVWTGSDMIVWGGFEGFPSPGDTNTGGIYNPSADSWTATPTTNAPTARQQHTAVWTGSAMIVWGGTNDSTGGRYSAGSWTATSTNIAPAPRLDHTAVWTGSEMIVWGGSSFNTGGRYNPSTDNWVATSTANAPEGRGRHTAVWTGNEMIVWGGIDGTELNTGGRYNPGADNWTATSTTNVPDRREWHTAVWTGTEMIVWGGLNSTMLFNTGGRYCAQSGAPSPTPTATPCASVGAWTEQASYPIATSGHAVVSVGGNVYSFGGIVNNAAITNAYKYSPATNTWTPIAPLPAPRGWFSGASDGTYIYLLGGVDQNFNTTATLWRYDPASNTYNTSLPSYTIPTYFHACAYLNGKIYRIAGAAIGTDFHVEVYDIATNTWSMAANYPFANHNLMAVALGSYIYAGGGNASPDKTYRYDPSTDTWDDAAVADFPAGRSSAASGAYNGRWLLAGGDVNFATSNSAIAWDPATNTWNDLPNMVQARDNLEGATAGQSFYAVAGDFGPGNPTNDNQQYTEVCATSTPTPTATATATSTSTATATPTPTPTATSTATPIATATFTPTPTATFTPTPTATFTPTTTPTLTPRPSPTPRVAPTPRPHATPPPRP
jgi:N-acetylneuraminic acid mutarotase